MFYFIIIVYFDNFRGGKNRGSMDPVHDRGSMDPVHISVDPVHGPGPRRGSMFCAFPGMSGCLSDKLQKLQNRAARVITQSPFDTSSNLLLAMLKWEKLSLRRKKQKALIMYKTLDELAPDYLQCLFTQRHVNDYNLRNLEGKLSLPKPNTIYLKRSFFHSGACLWNNLPQDLKSVCSIGQFKRGIKKVSEISDSHTAIM